MTTLIYLGGDSYPNEASFGKVLAQVLAADLEFEFLGQSQMLTADQLLKGTWKKVPDRVRQTKQFIDATKGEVVLVGRSSGARIATLLDAHPRVSAIVCLGYPFRFPGKAIEPDRYAHLATLKTPTMIMQGNSDPYGGSNIQRMYRLSNAVTLRFLDTNHELKLPPEAFGMMRKQASDFIQGPPRRCSPMLQIAQTFDRLTWMLKESRYFPYI